MSDIFGTPRPQQPPSGRGGVDRRRRVLVPTLVTLAVLLFLGSIFTSVWTDRLWFKSVDYSGVFTTMVLTRVGLFVALGLAFALLVGVNVYLAHRFRPANPPSRRDDPAFRYRTALDPVRKPALIVLTLVVAAFAGSVAQSRWDTFQLWRHGTSFGVKDPQFGKDQGFYVFDYPWLRFVSSFSFSAIVVTVLVTLFVLYVYGGIRLAGRGPTFTRAAQVQLSLLVGVGVLLRAFGYWLDRYGYVIKSSGVVHGATFTDVNARIPARNILIAVAIVCALLFFATVFLKSWVLPGIGLGLMLVTSVLLGGIWPYVMQSFQVRPSEPDKEAPYISRNIEATRQAYGVEDAEVRQYSAQTSLTPRELNESAEDRVSSRLLDPTLISEAFQQLQQVRGYYTVQRTLDVDRYRLGEDKQPQDVIIAAREVNLNGLQANQRNWANDHTVYTHGYGVIAARGNQRGPQGEPVWVEKDIPPVGDIPTKVPPRIYFGENTPSYSIVGRPKGADPIEVDIPRGGASAKDDDDAENATQNTYDGKGGVPVGSAFNKLLYAFKFADANIFLSSRVNENSKILYDRNPRDRVKKVAPWLTPDGDVYPAVVDGRVVWIVDGYTTSNSYAYSEHRSLREATDDTLTQGRAQAALPTDQVNYMRNSVKAVVDAYDGTVKLYQWDTKDPVLKAWMKVFPGVVEKKAAISEDLKAHLRYPVDLFKVQRDVLSRYHVTDAKTFYDGGERWKIPEDPAGSRDSLQPPYYLTLTRPGQTAPKFSLTTTYLPNGRDNLAAFMSVNSEASDANFGKLQILQLPSNTQVSGPSQIANDFQTDKGVTQALLQFEQSRQAKILRGNLLTLPVGDGLLYVQPVYIQRSSASGSYPVLQFVAATFGEEVGFGQTLDEALRVALGLEEGTITPDDEEATADGDSGSSGSSGSKTPAQYLEDASKRYSEAQRALRDGDLSLYQQKIAAMNRAVENAQKALE
ncbi:MAG: UPF0182 family protein [Aeromicrobium erythreum]